MSKVHPFPIIRQRPHQPAAARSTGPYDTPTEQELLAAMRRQTLMLNQWLDLTTKMLGHDFAAHHLEAALRRVRETRTTS